ncbi:MAG: translation initiation factor IF-2 associated domain-containing protein, partial [Paracoccaceae bacterium]
MSDTDGKKPLGLGGTPRSGSVKQSFSHGRTHAVVVETKRKRVVVPAAKPAGAAGGTAGGSGPSAFSDPSKRPAGISEAEMQRRLDALRSAKAREQEETAKRAADERERDEERQRRREEIEAKDREDRQREAALRARAEEEERQRQEAAADAVSKAAQRKADILGTQRRQPAAPAAAAPA